MSDGLKLKLYVIRDDKMAVNLAPMSYQNDLDAMRRSAIMTTNPESNLHHFPMEYSLLHVGEFDMTTAEITPCTPRIVATGPELVAMVAR